MPTAEEIEAQRKADEEAARKAAESDEENSDEEEDELSVEELKAQLAEQKKHIKSLNKESADRRKKLEEFEKKENERKEAELSEIEKANKRAQELEAHNATLAQQNKTLTLQRDFEARVRDANLTFKNSKAAKDAFKALVEDVLEEGDTEVTEEHVKQLLKERDYYFGKPDESTINNDGSKKGKNNPAVVTKEARAKKKFSL